MTYETMAATAYILITCDSGDEDHIIRALSQTSGITECSVLDGPYNMIIKMNADDMDKLDEVVAGRLKQIDKIKLYVNIKTNRIRYLKAQLLFIIIFHGVRLIMANQANRSGFSWIIRF